MLVLLREKNESIVIGGVVEITVLEIIRGRGVRLGITAPKKIPVHRKEIQLRIDEENKQKGVTNGIESNLSS